MADVKKLTFQCPIRKPSSPWPRLKYVEEQFSSSVSEVLEGDIKDSSDTDEKLEFEDERFTQWSIGPGFVETSLQRMKRFVDKAKFS